MPTPVASTTVLPTPPEISEPERKNRGGRPRKNGAGEDDKLARKREAARIYAATRRAAHRAAAARPDNGHGNGNGHDKGGEISAETFWAHARKLSPREPWRCVVREL